MTRLMQAWHRRQVARARRAARGLLDHAAVDLMEATGCSWSHAAAARDRWVAEFWRRRPVAA